MHAFIPLHTSLLTARHFQQKTQFNTPSSTKATEYEFATAIVPPLTPKTERELRKSCSLLLLQPPQTPVSQKHTHKTASIRSPPLPPRTSTPPPPVRYFGYVRSERSGVRAQIPHLIYILDTFLSLLMYIMMIAQSSEGRCESCTTFLQLRGPPVLVASSLTRTP